MANIMLNVIFVVANAFMAMHSYTDELYLTGMLNIFVAGFCLALVMVGIVEYGERK